jgi:two-component system chemotaxis response regulator CheY
MGITAIIAEDDPINLKLFAELLEINGISVVGQATNGKEVVTFFEELNPDVVFLDVMMPEFDGIYALEQIRKKNPSSKVVMVTADTSEETEQLLLKLKPSAVIRKPYEIITILHILENQLELKISSSD